MVIAKSWKEVEDEIKALDVINVIMSNNSNVGSPHKTNTMKNVSDWKANLDENVENAKIILISQTNSHPFQPRTIILEENIEIKVGRSIARSRATEHNAIFDCKVLSRNHAVLWYAEGKFYVKDTKSSNGTFINERRINQSEPEELSSGDAVKFGVDVIENSKKEIHGCIIASIKLYLPDGTEYISENNLNNLHKSDYTNEVVTIDQLHRLYHAMQETEQREKILEVKIHDLQNILDMTRKNTTDCWQAMVDEDRLLNRIDFLENKLNCYQKNYSEDRIKEDLNKLHEDKFIYQNLAKESLNKVYQDRLEANQKQTSLERALCSSENENSILRDQLLESQQIVQDMLNKLQKAEDECKQYKERLDDEELIRNQKTDENQESLLKSKEKECEEYKNYIDELLQEKNELKKRLSVQETLKSPVKSSSVICEWFKKSELGSNEDSAKIIEAICNENEEDETSIVEDNWNHLQNKLNILDKNIKLLNDKIDDKSTNDENINNESNDNIDRESIDRESILKDSLQILSETYYNIHKYATVARDKTAEDHFIQRNNEEIQSKVKNLESELEFRPTQSQLDRKIEEVDRLVEKLNSSEKTIEHLQNEKNDLEEKLLKVKDELIQKRDIIEQKIVSSQEESVDNEIQKDLDTVNDVNIQKEEELILFKEKYENVQTENHKLKDEIELLKNNINNVYNSVFIKFFTTTTIAVICYLIMSYL